MRRALSALLLLGCAGRSEPARSTTVTVPPPATEEAPTSAPSAAPVPSATSASASPAVLASCPKTYALAAARTCDLASAGKLTCTYPDGHCSCSLYSPCSGWAGAYEEARRHPRAEWTCVPRVRPDGCPGDAPAVGSRCQPAGKECGYAPCGGEILICRGGAWAVERQIGPPP